MKKLRSILDELIKEIKRLDKSNRCDQYSNKFGCCTKSDPFISEEESEEIKKFLKENIKIKDIVLNNLKESRKCYFYIDQKCSIENIRPISCRYVAFKIYEKKDCFKICSPYVPCKKECSTILSFSKEKVFKMGEFIKFIQNKEEEFYYIDENDIPEYKEYKLKEKKKLSITLEE